VPPDGSISVQAVRGTTSINAPVIPGGFSNNYLIQPDDLANGNFGVSTIFITGGFDFSDNQKGVRLIKVRGEGGTVTGHLTGSLGVASHGTIRVGITKSSWLRDQNVNFQVNVFGYPLPNEPGKNQKVFTLPTAQDVDETFTLDTGSMTLL